MKDHSGKDYRLPDSPAPPRFIADCMLGTLAKWLRILGYDTLYDRAAEDREIVRRAAAEDRVILTRDTRLVRRRDARRSLLIESDLLAEQIRQVVSAFQLPIDERLLLSRCLPCNEPIVSITRSEAVALGSVPPYVLRTQERFARCPSCGRIYWSATHHADIRRRLGVIGER